MQPYPGLVQGSAAGNPARVVTGFLMAFTFSLDDFVISYFTHGATAQPLSVQIFSMTRRKVSPEINALSTVIFIVVLSVLLLTNLYDARQERKAKRLLQKSGKGEEM